MRLNMTFDLDLEPLPGIRWRLAARIFAGSRKRHVSLVVTRALRWEVHLHIKRGLNPHRLSPVALGPFCFTIDLPVERVKS